MTRKCTERKPLQVGQKFGKLTVIGLDHIDKRVGTKGDIRYHYIYLCQCECGNKHKVRKTLLLSGNIKSCGCLQHTEEYQKQKGERQKKHGMTGTQLFKCWQGIKNRCNNPNMENYPNYGGRGITYCKEWQNFEPFMNWALANGYQEGLSIDRIDVNGNYEPSNCRWITMKEQCRNKRDNHYLTYNGETHCIAEWAEITGLKAVTIKRRIMTYKWSVEKTLTTKPKWNKYTYNGQSKSKREWAKIFGINYSTLKSRLRKGFTMEQILNDFNRKGGK